MSFEITFLGCSGGPVESSNCAILIKPALLSYKNILDLPNGPLIMIDAGAGMLSLAELVANEAKSPNRLLLLYHDSLPISEYTKVKRTYPFRNVTGPPIRVLSQIFAKVAGTLISHPHADHFQAVVLNLPGMTANAHKMPLYGSEFTMDTLKTHVFNGYVWPDMVKLGILKLNTLPSLVETVICNDTYSVTRFDLSHGRISDSNETYESLAFLLTTIATNDKILVFGDFESDTILGQSKNRSVWSAITPFVLDGSLKCMILECSIHSVAPGTELYGHLTPRHLMEELLVLNDFLSTKKRKPLKDFHIFVTHVKENIDGFDPRRKIKLELEELNAEHGLGISISMALSGLSVII